jgi:hypothetical protein
MMKRLSDPTFLLAHRSTAVCEWKSIRRYSRIIDADILRKEIGLVAHCTRIARILIN